MQSLKAQFESQCVSSILDTVDATRIRCIFYIFVILLKHISGKYSFKWHVHLQKEQKTQKFVIVTFFSRLCDNPLSESGILTLMEALSGNQSLKHLSLMHTGLGDQGTLELAQRLQQHTLQELNLAYNSIGDSAALALVEACRNHPTIHTVQ